jgi:hypothetical protein
MAGATAHVITADLSDTDATPPAGRADPGEGRSPGLLWTMHSTKGQREAIYP